MTGKLTPRFALLCQLPLGLKARQRIYRYIREGNIWPVSDVEFMGGGATLEKISKTTRKYEGLPPDMSFAAPSGFLGHQLA